MPLAAHSETDLERWTQIFNRLSACFALPKPVC